MKAERTALYIKCIYSYGIIPLLKVLEEYEKVENYEECELIYEAVTTVNSYDERHELLPTRYTPESIDWLKMNFSKFGFEGDIAISRIPYYMDKIKGEVK